tara:strand:+ start:372 stop:611 length:240 start_codon:yes stop_codon:yes gene_type:complete
MPLGDEVADFIDGGIHRDMTNEDVEEWCDTNIDDLTTIYEKYRGTYLSYGLAEMTLFFAQTVYERDDAHEMISSFVDFQ